MCYQLPLLYLSTSENIRNFDAQTWAPEPLLYTWSKNTVNAEMDIELSTTADMDSKTKRTFISHQGQPKGLPQGIKLIPGVGIHFRTWFFESYILT